MQEFTSDGVRIAFIDEPPTAPDLDQPILLIHGFASSHAVNWVFPLWVRALAAAGRRVIALDNRGHGRSEKLYDPAAYHTAIMARDARNLLDHLGIERADVMGYSMGARIGAFFGAGQPGTRPFPTIGGLGIHLVDGAGLPNRIADAMDAGSLEELTDPQQRTFRAFADATKSDRRALAACIRGSRQVLTPGQLAEIAVPVLICVGTDDDVAGDPAELATLIPDAQAVPIPGRDHNRAVGDKIYRQAVLAFLAKRP